jgi:hypothetical protein
VSRVSSAEKLEALKAMLEALLVQPELPSGDTKSSHRTEEIFATNIPVKDSSKNRKRATGADRSDEVSPALAASLASADYRSLLPSDRAPGWPDNRFLSLKFLSACGGLALFIGALIATILPTQFDGWSVWQSGKLIDHPAKMCRLIARKYGVTDCRVPEQERDLGLRVIAHGDPRNRDHLDGLGAGDGHQAASATLTGAAIS